MIEMVIEQRWRSLGGGPMGGFDLAAVDEAFFEGGRHGKSVCRSARRFEFDRVAGIL